MASRLHGPFTDYEIKASHEVEPDDETTIFHDQYSAEGFLRRFLGNYSAVAGMRAAAGTCLWGGPLAGTSDDNVLRQLAYELTAGRLHLVSVAHRTASSGGRGSRRGSVSEPGSPVDPMPSTGPAPHTINSRRAAEFSEAPSWITFEIVDDETGEPVAGVMLHLRLPDGSVRTVTSDGGGVVHVTDLPPGAFDVEKVFGPEVFEIVEFA